MIKPKPLPKFFYPIITYISPLSIKERLLKEHFKVKPASFTNVLTPNEFVKSLNEREKHFRDKQLQNLLSSDEMKKIEESH